MISLKPGANGVLELDRKDFGTSDAFADNTGWTNVSMFGGPMGMSHTGLAVNPVTSLQSGAAYACMRILTGDIAKLPLRLMQYKNGIWIPQPKHRLSSILRKPNRRMTTCEMITSWVFSLMFVGNSYSAILRDDNGYPLQIIPALPATVSVREDMQGKLFYTFSGNRLISPGSATLIEEDVMHVRSMSIDGGIRGASPVQMCSEVLGLSLATQQLAAEMFKNGAFFNGYLTTDLAVNKQALDDISNQWQKNRAGLGNGYKTPVFGNGFKFNPLSMSAEQAQLLESRKQIVEEVARIFGVPLYKLGANEKSSYNSIDAQAQDYIDTTLIPITNPIEHALNKTLLLEKEMDGFKFEFDFSALERGDIKTRTEFWHQMLTDGVFSVNEVRKDMNKESVPEGDVRTKPMNVGTVGDTSGLPNVEIDGPIQRSENEGGETNDKVSD